MSWNITQDCHELYFEEICTGSGITAREERQQQENQTRVANLANLATLWQLSRPPWWLKLPNVTNDKTTDFSRSLGGCWCWHQYILATNSTSSCPLGVTGAAISKSHCATQYSDILLAWASRQVLTLAHRAFVSLNIFGLFFIYFSSLGWRKTFLHHLTSIICQLFILEISWWHHNHICIGFLPLFQKIIEENPDPMSVFPTFQNYIFALKHPWELRGWKVTPNPEAEPFSWYATCISTSAQCPVAPRLFLLSTNSIRNNKTTKKQTNYQGQMLLIALLNVLTYSLLFMISASSALPVQLRPNRLVPCVQTVQGNEGDGGGATG